jgi:hypothetical protein
MNELTPQPAGLINVGKFYRNQKFVGILVLILVVLASLTSFLLVYRETPANAYVTGTIFLPDSQCHYSPGCLPKWITFTDISKKLNVTDAPTDGCVQNGIRLANCACGFACSETYSITLPNLRTFSVTLLYTNYNGQVQSCYGGTLYTVYSKQLLVQSSQVYNVNC